MSKLNRIPRVGILSPGTEAGLRNWWDALILGLVQLGYVEGTNIEFVWRFGNGRFEQLPDPAQELVECGVDIIMPASHPRSAPRRPQRSIPIVFPLGSDPVETGLVSSIERPGGNLTGVARMLNISIPSSILSRVTKVVA